jgi:chemotaxis protein MotA
MDRGTWIGFLLGLGLLVLVIALGPNPRVFLHPASLVVVFGGILASTLIRFPWSNVRSALDVASRAFFTHPAPPQALVSNLVSLSQRARREGFLGLEKHLPDDSFMRQGVLMLVDGVSREHLNDVLTQEIHATQDRHALGQEIFRFIATAAPSFGMVGTLIGMVQLFVSIKDPTGIGQGMALSLLSTFYGAVVAYLFAVPISGKLELRSREEMQNKKLILDGILGIQAEMNPGQLEEQLSASLAPRFKIRRHEGARRG